MKNKAARSIMNLRQVPRARACGLVSDKRIVVKPKSVPITVANYFLFGIGLFILSFSRNHLLSMLGAVTAGYPIMRGYKIAKDRRLQLYSEEINRRMQNTEGRIDDPRLKGN
jgi:hypothetical protein